MSDDSTTPQSGSRWEPRTDAPGAPTPPPVPPVEHRPDGGPSAHAPGDGPHQAPAPGRSSWATRVRGRGGLLAGAAALVLAAGVGGFAAAEVAHHPDGNPSTFGVGSQPQDAGFPGLPPGAGDDDGGIEGHGHGDDDGGRLGAPLGGQVGGQVGGDDGAQQGGSL
ncbi:MAG: hypothetical protein ACTHKG_01265 [Nocardioides sp.]